MDQKKNQPSTSGDNKTYNPQELEQRLYNYWETNGFFNSDVDVSRESYTIVIPPPNVTGALHLGHALNNLIQDVLIRFHRQLGFNALWMPGTDHAGIATQSVVEKKLFVEEGKTRHDLGREKLIERIWSWKEEYEKRIIGQLKRIGCSCDWRRQAFTMNPDLHYAVRFVFMKLYEEGLVYRGKRLINWSPGLRTALSNDELVYKTVQTHFWHMTYPVKGMKDTFIEIATTRPETMLGDTAVAVHPDDPRYKDLIGKFCILPLTNREIPIVADALLADPEKGTGAVKVTPAHDPNDYACYQRNNLEIINILNDDATINENGGKYQGLKASTEARKAVVKDLKEQGFIVKILDYAHDVAHCYRTDDIVEPYLSTQWFVKMKPLIKLAESAVTDGKVNFVPKSREKVYLDWVKTTPDWCISRQIWWGHRLPIWYCTDCNKDLDFNDKGELLSIPDNADPILPPSPDIDSKPTQCPKCNGTNLVQDVNVLDTWFSSQLWPLSTFGWPRETKELEYYYPTNVLSTARDIIALWVARMVMMGMKFRKQVPFNDVFIHSTILDDFGDIMSKSRGNGIDPVKTIIGGDDEIHGKFDVGTGANRIPKDRFEIYPVYGTDALRYSIIAMTTQGQDIRLRIDRTKRNETRKSEHYGEMPVYDVSIPKLEEGKRFMNKIWQVTTGVIFRQCENFKPMSGISPYIEDRYITHKLKEGVEKVHASLKKYHFSVACDTIYTLFWEDFCSFYVEIIKPRLWKQQSTSSKLWAQTTLIHMLDAFLRLMHPIIPFITEELWQQLKVIFTNSGMQEIPQACIIAPFPKSADIPADAQSYEIINKLRKVIFEINKIRSSQDDISENTVIPKVIIATENQELLQEFNPLFDGLKKMCKIAEIETEDVLKKHEKSAAAIVDDISVIIPFEGLIDYEAEKERINKEIEKLTDFSQKLEKKLANKNYVAKAPAEIVEKDRQKLADNFEKLEKLRKHLKSLEQ